ncbi:MAG: MFS transporter, partial [Candidatus Omnitrophica bacterium]|nr:MFS transporter [Candidatus Omnitrophota bacterium]
VADRFFATERILGILHLLGGAAMLAIPTLAAGNHPSPTLFLGCLLLHMLCYMPTLGLINTLSFHNLDNPEKEFPLIRVFGTLGWIFAGILVSKILGADETAIPLWVAGFGSLVMGVYSFTLPHTPPPGRGKEISIHDILCLDALSLLKDRSFTVFVVCSFLVCIPLSAYYAFAPIFIKAMDIENPAFQMSFGQMSEVFFMIVMPFFFARLGVKWMLIVGMLAWVTRYGLFAIGAPDKVMWMAIVGILLHGICYDFFFVTGQIYVDKKAPLKIRGQAQGFLVLVTLGLGMLVGAQVAGWLNLTIVTAEGVEKLLQWRQFWAIPAIGAGLITVIFGLLFTNGAAEQEQGKDAA